MKSNGSALVFSLIILSMVLAIALGVTSVSVVERKNASSTGKSTQAFQVADSAIETVLKKAKDAGKDTDLNELGGACSASGGVAVVTLPDLSGGDATLTFSDKNLASISSCAVTLDQIGEVKAVGQFGSTTRAIGAASAAGTLSWLPTSGTVSFASGWTNWGSPYNNVGYAKDDRTSMVYLRGLIRHSSTDATGAMFTLPEGYRPAARKAFISPCNSSATANMYCRIDIETNGNVNMVGAGFWASFEGMYFSLN